VRVSEPKSIWAETLDDVQVDEQEQQERKGSQQPADRS